ncbi:hypothetical protein D9756_006262 [Leucocoprinus leucothites]|uniref:Uncharacterized protein n=1 Tax=Leucocoprinus leucothites TaxID=201217 RepID=A0A8H5D2T3_9AGAR|nr:hypothetical protein D9756_006262 [Leucoagaricus leucothites]
MATPVMEHAYYIGNYMGGILYGVEIVMYFSTLNHLAKNSSLAPSRKRFFAIYSTVLLLLLTGNIATNSVWGEIMWIQGRNHPGGVPGWFVEEVSVWYQTLSTTCVVGMIFMGDALLLQRLFILWDGNWWIMIFPIIAYLAGFAMAMIELVIAGKPGGNFFGGHIINFGLPYYAITIGLNIIVTALICFRLLRLSRAISRVLGKESSYMYTNVMALLVESAAPYSIVGLMFLIPYGLGSDTFIGFGQVWAKLTCLCPQLIVLRVVSGKAWKRRMVTQAETSVLFEHTQKEGGVGQLELPERRRVEFAITNSTVDEEGKSPQESSGSTFAGSPIEKWRPWESNGNGSKVDV